MYGLKEKIHETDLVVGEGGGARLGCQEKVIKWVNMCISMFIKKWITSLTDIFLNVQPIFPFSKCLNTRLQQ